MSSLIDVDHELGRPSRGRLLFSNPDDAEVRRRITIRARWTAVASIPRERRLCSTPVGGRATRAWR